MTEMNPYDAIEQRLNLEELLADLIEDINRLNADNSFRCGKDEMMAVSTKKYGVIIAHAANAIGTRIEQLKQYGTYT